MRRAWLPAILALGISAGCASPIGIAGMPCVRLSLGEATGTVLTGEVRAPAVVMHGEPTSGQPLAETPVAQADIYLADATGLALPGLARGRTDAQGRYRLEGVPGGHTYVVVAGFPLRDGRAAMLRTLARAEAGTITADLTLATTLVAADLTDVLRGFNANLEAAPYQEAVVLTHRLLANDRVPDLAEDGDVLRLASTLLNVSPDLRSVVSRLKRALATAAAPPLATEP